MMNFSNTFKLMKVLLVLLFVPMMGYAQYYNDVLSYRYHGTPTNGIKIQTNMPYASSQQMPTIMIEGYDYAKGIPIDLKIVYYIYADKYINHKVVSNTSYTPDIYLSEENGKVVIFIDDKSYYVRFHVRAYAYMSEQASWFTGWTHSDTPKASGLPAGREVLVPYDNTTLPAGVKENFVTQIYAPEGGSFTASGPDLTGAIKIKLPVLYTNTMVKFRVEVFNYLTDKSFTAIISGYNYAPTTTWHNCSAQIITTSPDNAHKVYFGDDGTNTVVWIGEADSNWSYLKVRVSEVQAGHGNFEVDTWNKNWNISLDAGDFSSNVNRTVSNTLPVASGLSETPTLPATIKENAITQIYAPQGGSFVKNGPDVVGAIKIKLPVLYTNTMLRFRVEVFNYVTDKSFTAIIAGYNYEPTTTWYNCSAQIITSSLDNAHKVYFGDDGTNTMVWIGEPDSEWKYLKVRISEVQATHLNNEVDTWNKNWSINLETNDFSGNVNRTVSNTLPVSSGSSIWQNTNDNVYYLNPDGKVGIGTNTPSAELTVNGHIHAQEIRVYTDAGADFVFDENYNLIDIDELEKYVTENKHLPDIPSEKEMIEEGLHLGEMNIKLLQKVEELTLYIIDMNKKLEALSAENEKLKNND